MNFSDLKSQETIRFNSSAPKWRIVTRGLNLEGTCQNSECEANQMKVWLKIGFGLLNLNEIIACQKCPQCDVAINQSTIKTMGFTTCRFQVTG